VTGFLDPFEVRAVFTPAAAPLAFRGISPWEIPESIEVTPAAAPLAFREISPWEIPKSIEVTPAAAPLAFREISPWEISKSSKITPIKITAAAAAAPLEFCDTNNDADSYCMYSSTTDRSVDDVPCIASDGAGSDEVDSEDGDSASEADSDDEERNEDVDSAGDADSNDEVVDDDDEPDTGEDFDFRASGGDDDMQQEFELVRGRENGGDVAIIRFADRRHAETGSSIDVQVFDTGGRFSTIV